MLKAFNQYVKRGLSRLVSRSVPRFNSAQYWDQRYKNNGTSGAGSYNHLAEFKANFLNSFVEKNAIQSVVEFGCGDGNQLRLARYPKYIGFDVSPTSIDICKEIFAEDKNKVFCLSSNKIQQVNAELSLSLDVIYHLVEDEVYHYYMEQLFRSSSRWVIVYSSNTNINDSSQSIHVRHRKFTDWIECHAPNFRLVQHVSNKYPSDRYGIHGSFADFFVFEMRI